MWHHTLIRSLICWLACWSVTDVVPAIDVTSLIMKLNRDLDLSSFVAAMRRTWRTPFITAAAAATAAVTPVASPATASS